MEISRRGMLVTLAGGIVSARRAGAMPAQAPAPRIDRFAPELDAIVSVSEPVRELATGFGNDAGATEGPLWLKEGGYLLFSDIGNDRRIKYTPGQGTSVFKEATNRANGLTRDLQGRLVAAEQETRRIARIEADGRVTVVADRYEGKRLNRPNDVVVKSDGSIYFTDPFNRDPPEGWEQAASGVRRVSPDLKTVTLVADNFMLPNGLAFSPDERLLYVTDSRRRDIRAFDVMADGTLNRKSERVFADLSGPEMGNPDGMKVDSAGNVYCGGAGGLFILNSAGKRLGRIVHGTRSTTNVGFGGEDWKTLFFTTRNALWSVRTLVAGIPVPVLTKRREQ